MSKPVRFTAKFEFDHGVVTNPSGDLTYEQAEVMSSVILAVLWPAPMVPDEFKA